MKWKTEKINNDIKIIENKLEYFSRNNIDDIMKLQLQFQKMMYVIEDFNLLDKYEKIIFSKDIIEIETHSKLELCEEKYDEICSEIDIIKIIDEDKLDEKMYLQFYSNLNDARINYKFERNMNYIDRNNLRISKINREYFLTQKSLTTFSIFLNFDILNESLFSCNDDMKKILQKIYGILPICINDLIEELFDNCDIQYRNKIYEFDSFCIGNCYGSPYIYLNNYSDIFHELGHYYHLKKFYQYDYNQVKAPNIIVSESLAFFFEILGYIYFYKNDNIKTNDYILYIFRKYMTHNLLLHKYMLSNEDNYMDIFRNLYGDNLIEDRITRYGWITRKILYLEGEISSYSIGFVVGFFLFMKSLDNDDDIYLSLIEEVGNDENFSNIINKNFKYILNEVLNYYESISYKKI